MPTGIALSTLRGPTPDRKSRFPTRRACGYAPTGGAAREDLNESAIGHLDADIAGFGEEAQRFKAAFAADAGIFDAAERRTQVAHHPAVDPDDARLERRGHAVRTVEVARPHGGDEAIS